MNQSVEIILIQGPDGSLSAAIAPGQGISFEQGAAALERFYATIGQEIPIAGQGRPEQHLDDKQHQTAHRLGAGH